MRSIIQKEGDEEAQFSPLKCWPLTSFPRSYWGLFPLLLLLLVIVRSWSCSSSFHTAPSCSTGRPAGSRVWTQHFSPVSICGRVQWLLFSGLLLHYWIRGLPQTWIRTWPRGNMQIWWINVLQWSGVEGKLAAKGCWENRSDRVSAMKIFTPPLLLFQLHTYMLTYMCVCVSWDKFTPYHTYAGTHTYKT